MRVLNNFTKFTRKHMYWSLNWAIALWWIQSKVQNNILNESAAKLYKGNFKSDLTVAFKVKIS